MTPIDPSTPAAAQRPAAPVAATRSLFDPAIVAARVVDSFRKLDPRAQARNPVMFVVLVGSVLTTILFFRDLGDSTRGENVFAGLVAACSCGSPCCSPTSPRRWPKGGARRRRRRCARPAPRRWPTGAGADGHDRGGRQPRSCASATTCVVRGRAR